MPWPRPSRWGFTKMADLERRQGRRHDAFLAKELETCPLKMASKNEVFKHLSLEQVVVPMLVGGGASAFQPQSLESLRVQNFMSWLSVQ